MKSICFFLFMSLLMLASFTIGVENRQGDVNRDGKVSVSDTLCINDESANSQELQTETFTVNGVQFKMVYIKEGMFTMGGTAEQGTDAEGRELPIHQVTLSSYWIGETEVTQALWVAVMGSNPSWFTPANGYSENLQRPVECVSWNDCQKFITKLNELTGKNFRLPTEAEWEYAARGGKYSQGYKYAGNNDIEKVAWFWYDIQSQQVSTEGCATQAVAIKLPNELGLYDMSGNVWEWCQDWYGLWGRKALTNPRGPKLGTYRVCRGGSWYNSDWNCRVSYRGCSGPTYSYDYQGFRLAL